MQCHVINRHCAVVSVSTQHSYTTTKQTGAGWSGLPVYGMPF